MKTIEKLEKIFLKQWEKKKKDYLKRVNAGVKWLDTKMPRKEWLDKINPKVLNMGNVNKCICGQVFGEYWEIVADWKDEEGKMSEEEASSLGFVEIESVTGYEEDYDLLATMWHDKVVELKRK